MFRLIKSGYNKFRGDEPMKINFRRKKYYE